MSDHKKYTSIKLNASVYNTYKTRPNTVPHALGEFIDNAIGSYQQNKERLFENNPNYKLIIDINIEWADKKTSKITIKDNAAGISEYAYQAAFEPAHKPEYDKGMNEFGMGMKDAALWLGDTWRVVSSALGEPLMRDLTFDLKKVAENNLTSLPYDEIEADSWKHGTTIEITNPTHNSPAQTKLLKIQEDISGIYREFLRNDEVEIRINGDLLKFEEYEVLNAPYYATPKGESLEWKVEFDTGLIMGRYRIHGFVGLLEQMSKRQRGIVLIRRGRVIKGEDENSCYEPKEIVSATASSPRAKRIFGEMFLEGFEVSHDKSEIIDTDELDSIMPDIRKMLKVGEYDLLTQGDNYRKKDIEKEVKTLVSKHKENKKPISIDINEKPAKQPEVESQPIINESIKETYEIKDERYTLVVNFVNEGEDLFWLDTTEEESKILKCMVNCNHKFFETYPLKNSGQSTVRLLMALAVSKFCHQCDDVDDMVDRFNQILGKL
ncbi:MAG: ATP-binding protein [Bacteroidales bacterium]|nr:ATP-binding protein [Bacteroidales bacterium]